MKFTVIASLAMATFAAGQSLSDVPKCAIPCLADSISQSTNCAVTDVSCVCSHFDVIQGAATACIIKACGSEDALSKVVPATKQLCAGTKSTSGTINKAQNSAASIPSSSATVIPPAPASSPTTPPVVAGAAGVSSLGALGLLAVAALAL